MVNQGFQSPNHQLVGRENPAKDPKAQSWNQQEHLKLLGNP